MRINTQAAENFIRAHLGLQLSRDERESKQNGHRDEEEKAPTSVKDIFAQIQHWANLKGCQYEFREIAADKPGHFKR